MPTLEKQIKPIAARLAGKYQIDPNTNCYVWTRSHSSQGKYPTIGMPGTGKPVYVHRYAWESVHGPIPSGKSENGGRLEIHHQCHNRSCVNPAHMELVTHREHMALHKFDRRWKKSLAAIAPFGFIPSSYGQVAA